MNVEGSYHFLEQGSRRALHCGIQKLREAIRRRRPEKNVDAIKLHHDNARPHASLSTNQWLAEMEWSVDPHPDNSLDIITSPLGALRDVLRCTRFNDTEEVKDDTRLWVTVFHRLFPKLFPGVGAKIG